MPGCRNSARPPKMQFICAKEKLRPLIREADLYHISPRPDGVHWDAVEYWQPRTRQGVVYVFHGSETGEGAHTFVLAGLGSTSTTFSTSKTVRCSLDREAHRKGTDAIR